MDVEEKNIFLNKRNQYREKDKLLKREIEKSEKMVRHWEREGERIYDVLDNPDRIIEELSNEFREQTTLREKDMALLFLATSLQVLRITLINNVTRIEKAGKGNRNEEMLHNFQSNVFEKINKNVMPFPENEYYAAKSHILTRYNVPYDATAFVDERFQMFKGANHRFATLGHDPILGLLFGTANIMTNTITCVNKSETIGSLIFPTITTNHVIYDEKYKNPKIGVYGSTKIMLDKAMQRSLEDPSVLVISLLKQLIHIGTDLYTPCGIQIPAANLVLSNTNVEKLTRYISTGDILKIGVSGEISSLINKMIEILHLLTYKGETNISKEVFSVRTKKIVIYSNVIASQSNIIYSLLMKDLKLLDIGGLIVTINRIAKDRELIQKIQDEFIYGGYEKQTKLKELSEEEITEYGDE